MPVSRFFNRLIAYVLIIAFLSTSLYVPKSLVYASAPLPAFGSMVYLSSAYIPAHLQGLTIYPNDPFKFDFLIYKGDGHLTDGQKKEEYTKLIKYFLASLTVPDQDQWVNLSPYEHDRIIADNFGKTEMGQNLLSQDYFLKQITSSLMYPESGLGKIFWDKIYATAWEKFHTTDIPVDTFNKVWIVPDQATVYESGNTAYIIKSHLKVMLEEDYLALSKNVSKGPVVLSTTAHTAASQVIKDIILPAIEKEVNEGKNFALLRQIVSGMILATWYKKELKESLLGKIYADKAKVKGVDQDPRINEVIYQKYLSAFKKGIYNYIKEDEDKYTHQLIPRKYFSGGFGAHNQAMVSIVRSISGKDMPFAMKAWDDAAQEIEDVSVLLSTKKSETNQAMGALFHFPVMYGQPSSLVVDHLKRLMFNYLPDSSPDPWTKYVLRLGQGGTKLMALVQEEKNNQAISFLVRIYPGEQYEVEIWNIRENLARIKNINEKWKQKIIERLRLITAQQIQTITREDLETIVRAELNDIYNSNLEVEYREYRDLLHLFVLDDRLFGGSFRRVYQFIKSQHDSSPLMKLFESYRDNRGKADTRIIEDAIKRHTMIREVSTIDRIADFMKVGQNEDAKYYELKTAPWFDLELTRINGRYVLRVIDEAGHGLSFGILPKTDEQDALKRFEEIYNFARHKKMRPRNLVKTLIKDGKLEDPIYVAINAAMSTRKSSIIPLNERQITDVRALMQEVKAIMLNEEYRREVKKKADGTDVTVADEKAQELFDEELPKIIKGSTVFGEESYAPQVLTDAKKAEDVWVVDPIDGTSEYARGGVSYSSALVLLRKGQPVYAAILAPKFSIEGKDGNLLEAFVDREGVFLNGKQLPPMPDGALNESHLAYYESSRTRPLHFLNQVKMQEGLSVEDNGGNSSFIDVIRIVTNGLTGSDHRVLTVTPCAPWDIWAGAWMILKAGGEANYIDGTPMIPARFDVIDSRDGKPRVPASIMGAALAQGQVLQMAKEISSDPAMKNDRAMFTELLLRIRIVRELAIAITDAVLGPIEKRSYAEKLAMRFARNKEKNKIVKQLRKKAQQKIDRDSWRTSRRDKRIAEPRVRQGGVIGRIISNAGNTGGTPGQVIVAAPTGIQIAMRLILITSDNTDLEAEIAPYTSAGDFISTFAPELGIAGKKLLGDLNKLVDQEGFGNFDTFERYFKARKRGVHSSKDLDAIEALERPIPDFGEDGVEVPQVFFLSRSAYINKRRKIDEPVLKAVRKVYMIKEAIERGLLKPESISPFTQKANGIYRVPLRDNWGVYFRIFTAEDRILIIAHENLSKTHATDDLLKSGFSRLEYEYDSDTILTWESLKAKVNSRGLVDLGNLAMKVKNVEGGIDLNSTNLAMIIKRDGKGIVLPLAQQDMAQLNRIEGLFPNILKITPATNLQILDELKSGRNTGFPLSRE